MRSVYLVVLVTLLILSSFAASAGPAEASGIVSVCDEAHVLAALAGGGAVTFSCSGTITLTSTITIATDTSIDGTGQAVTISGGGAVRVLNLPSGVTLELNGLTVANGRASGAGGIYNDHGTLTVSNCTFLGNSAGNGSWDVGGAILNFYGALTVSNSTFSGNSAYVGGGIWSTGAGSVTGSTFSGNAASGSGGAISGVTSVSNSSFSGNTAVSGGGAISGAVSVSNSTFSANVATGNGGAIIGVGTITNSAFTGNSAAYGGGIYSEGLGPWTVANSTFSGNSATYGGGILNRRGGLSVGNSTFSGNSATNRGGGIDVFLEQGGLEVRNSTFSGNSAAEGGAIFNPNTTSLINTIVANSPLGGNCAGGIFGAGNLSYPDASCGGINKDPLLGPLHDNGGPTQSMALGPGSPAIDAAIDVDCAVAPVNNLDQRGITRPQGAHCDIGAYEAAPTGPTNNVHLYLPLVTR